MPSAGTEKQARFVAAYVVNGGNATAAALEAGYSEKSASDIGYRLAKLPHINEAIMSELLQHKSRAGAVGLAAVVKVAQSDSAPAAARVAAGRTLMEFAELVGPGARLADGTRNPVQGAAAPDYKAILDSFANISRVAIAAAVVETDRPSATVLEAPAIDIEREFE